MEGSKTGGLETPWEADRNEGGSELSRGQGCAGDVGEYRRGSLQNDIQEAWAPREWWRSQFKGKFSEGMLH